MSYDLNDPEQVKQYLEDLGTEYRFGCYSEKDPQVCHLLGNYMEAVKEDYRKANKIYKTNCDDYGYQLSCHSYATFAFLGRGQDKPNFDDAFKYFSKACDSNNSVACCNAGLMLISEDSKYNKERDYTKGLALLDKSCSLKDAISCFYLSGLFLKGSRDQVIKQDMTKAFEYSKKACDLNHIGACANLSLMYNKGDGVEKNIEMSEKIQNKVKELQQEQKLELEFQRGHKFGETSAATSKAKLKYAK